MPQQGLQCVLFIEKHGKFPVPGRLELQRCLNIQTYIVRSPTKYVCSIRSQEPGVHTGYLPSSSRSRANWSKVKKAKKGVFLIAELYKPYTGLAGLSVSWLPWSRLFE